MPAYGLLSTSVLVNGNALEEFDVTERDGVYSCWIASQEGKVRGAAALMNACW